MYLILRLESSWHGSKNVGSQPQTLEGEKGGGGSSEQKADPPHPGFTTRRPQPPVLLHRATAQSCGGVGTSQCGGQARGRDHKAKPALWNKNNLRKRNPLPPFLLRRTALLIHPPPPPMIGGTEALCVQAACPPPPPRAARLRMGHGPHLGGGGGYGDHTPAQLHKAPPSCRRPTQRVAAMEHRPRATVVVRALRCAGPLPQRYGMTSPLRAWAVRGGGGADRKA